MNRSFAPCAAIRQSHANKRSIAPPTAWPFTSASVGTGSAAIRRHASVPRAVTSAPGRPVMAARSAPAEKIREPAPVIVTSRTAASAASSSARSASCSSASSDSALSTPCSVSTP
jgi:hypothetical protein